MGTVATLSYPAALHVGELPDEAAQIAAAGVTTTINTTSYILLQTAALYSIAVWEGTDTTVNLC